MSAGYNKKPFSVTLFASVMFASASLISNHAFAQTFNEDDLLISDEGDSSSSSGLNFTDYITGEFGLISGGNAGVSRRSTIYNVGVDIPWDWGRVYATYGGVEFDLKITQELRESIQNDPNQDTSDLPLERTISTNTKDVGLREAFVQLNLGSYVTFEAGRQRNPWGQFELLSPATIMLPFNANFTSIIPNKLDLLYAQNQAVVKIFPTSKVEIGLYSIDGLATDNSGDESALLWLQPFNKLENGIQGGKLVSIGENEEIDFGYKETYEKNQSALRLVFYPDWGTIGFTYHKGYNAFVPLLRTPIAAGDSNPERNSVDTVVASAYIDEKNSYLYYAEGTNTALEISVPVGRFVWRLETSFVDSYSGVDQFGGNIYLIANDGENGFSSDLVNNFLTIAGDGDPNDPITGTALFKSRVNTSAFGFIYQGNEWTFNVTAIMLGTPEPTTARGKQMLALYQQLEAETANNEDGSSFGAVPLVNGFRSRGDEDQHRYGFALGAIGVGFGIGGIYGYKITEDISINTSLGFAQLNTNSNSDSAYENKNEFGGLTTQLSLTWRF
ncbi:MAG: hypothetical protein K0U45_10310 [Alphaproteobacteria bacterium]|nr:hypothetical protein [Alphaproteobacteria bacterium]